MALWFGIGSVAFTIILWAYDLRNGCKPDYDLMRRPPDSALLVVSGNPLSIVSGKASCRISDETVITDGTSESFVEIEMAKTEEEVARPVERAREEDAVSTPVETAPMPGAQLQGTPVPQAAACAAALRHTLACGLGRNCRSP